MNILFHADGGKNVGLGHLSRCVALASALQKLGHQVLIVVELNNKLGPYLKTCIIPYCELSIVEESLYNFSVDFNSDLLVIDSYRWMGSDFLRIKGDWPIVVFDDEAIRDLPVNAVINGSPVAANLDYRVASDTQLWLGLPYQVVRDEFHQISPRILNETVSQIIVLVGGDDPLQLLASLAPALDLYVRETSSSFIVELICGPFTLLPNLNHLRNVKITRNPIDLARRMRMADIAVSAAGQTLYELARCGTPTIAFCSGKDQIHNLEALSAMEIVLNAGHASSADWLQSIIHNLKFLTYNYNKRVRLSRNAQKLIDGLGSTRLAKLLVSLKNS